MGRGQWFSSGAVRLGDCLHLECKKGEGEGTNEDGKDDVDDPTCGSCGIVGASQSGEGGIGGRVIERSGKHTFIAVNEHGAEAEGETVASIDDEEEEEELLFLPELLPCPEDPELPEPERLPEDPP